MSALNPKAVSSSNAAWPTLQAVRTKRGAAARDIIPDESFLRLRGALFFGPGFLVTRNKLTFRDNLQELLASAVASPLPSPSQFAIQYSVKPSCLGHGCVRSWDQWIQISHE